MTNIDRAIREALSQEDAEFLARFEENNPIGEALGAFAGRWGPVNVFAALLAFVLFFASVYCGWRMFAAEDLRDIVLWGVGTLIGLLSVAMLKMYFWMEINKNAVLREVKRLELQIARAAARDAV